PVVCDMSSDILSRPLDVSKYALIYAGAQKNMGPSGVTVVIIREDLIERVPDNMATMLDYRLQAQKNSLFNTPPSFSIYLLGLVLQWLLDIGGLQEIARRNEAKAQLLYEAIDESGGFYHGHAQPADRSLMNVTFRMESAELEAAFAQSALEQGMVGLKGHRSVGGLRASIYNACPKESVEALVAFMSDFQKQQG
ncbi:MAG: 3-phosphoserine/phosphohydroxythreonine transaminase, partial [Candidatus Promineifilaceae bacterium]|nr:3-phosphoserine/phosphohydroxythreonine transaminase [Candidatus Promineifilaceae bacterium]